MRNNLILDVNENPKKVSHWLLFATQHILAMFVACITVPLLTGIPIDATIVASGIGTLFYIFTTKKKSPVFLSSSFAYISPICSALALGNAVNNNFLAVMIGMAIVGLVYVIVALVIKYTGTNWLDKLLPPIVIGPVIMVIGLGLAVSAVNNLQNTAVSAANYNIWFILCGLVAMFVTAITAVFGTKTLKLIPFVIGMVSGYLFALVLTLIGNAADNAALKVIDFTPIVENFETVKFTSFLKVPDFIFLKDFSSFDASQIPQIILLFAPVALVTICEHIGDHKNLSNIIDVDLTKDPGLTRTLIGDGVATAISGVLCGAANTTYGENVAVVGVSRIASVGIIILSAAMTVLLGFFRPLMVVVETIPACITGGVSLILYGFIASSGVKMLIAEKIDFNDTKNIFVSSVILVAGIGALTIQIGSFVITSTAVAMILGIILNTILSLKKTKDEALTVAELEEIRATLLGEEAPAKAEEQVSEVPAE